MKLSDLIKTAKEGFTLSAKDYNALSISLRKDERDKPVILYYCHCSVCKVLRGENNV